MIRFREGEIKGAGLTDVGGLYHTNIVPTIANTAYPFLRIATNETRYVRFLRRRTAAGDDSG